MTNTTYLNIGDMDTDYIDKSGNLVKNDDAKMVMVRSKADLDALEGYRPGTIAHTAGFKNMWQLDADGEWQVIVEEVSNG